MYMSAHVCMQCVCVHCVYTVCVSVCTLYVCMHCVCALLCYLCEVAAFQCEMTSVLRSSAAFCPEPRALPKQEAPSLTFRPKPGPRESPSPGPGHRRSLQSPRGKAGAPAPALRQISRADSRRSTNREKRRSWSATAMSMSAGLCRPSAWLPDPSLALTLALALAGQPGSGAEAQATRPPRTTFARGARECRCNRLSR